MLTLPAAWEITVTRAPKEVALICAADGRSWSRAELDAEAAAWCAARPHLAPLNRRRVLLAEPNGLEWWCAFLGLLRGGAIPVAVDPGEPEERLREIGRNVRAAGVIRGGVWHPMSLPRVRRRERPDEVLVKLTSGSTGAPRALPFSHAQMLADGRQICAGMGIGARDLNLAVIPFGHSYGLGNLVVPLLEQGSPVLVASSPLPQVLAAECRRYAPTVFPTVPPLLRALVRAEIETTAFRSVRLVISAGAPLGADVAQAFAARFGRSVHSFYGSSETGGISYDCTGEATLTARSVGTPLPGVTVRLRRDRRPVIASAAVGGRGRYSPADRAEINELGELVLLGRAGKVVKIGARRVNLGEIEAALRAIAGVSDAFVAVHPTRPDALGAIVAGRVESAALRASLRSRLAAWKVPDRLLVLAEFPVNARGKTDTRQLRQRLAELRPAPASDQGSTPKSK